MLRKQKNFLNMKNIFSIINNEKLSKTDLKILLVMIEEIKNFDDIILMNQKRLVKKTNIDQGNISRALKKLLDLEIIYKLEDHNVYRLGKVIYEDIDIKKSKV